MLISSPVHTFSLFLRDWCSTIQSHEKGTNCNAGLVTNSNSTALCTEKPKPLWNCSNNEIFRQIISVGCVTYMSTAPRESQAKQGKSIAYIRLQDSENLAELYHREQQHQGHAPWSTKTLLLWLLTCNIFLVRGVIIRNTDRWALFPTCNIFLVRGVIRNTDGWALFPFCL